MSGVHVPPTLVLRGLAAFAYVDDVSVSVTNHPKWTDEDVISYLDEITALGRRVSATAAIADFRAAMFGPRERRVLMDWMARENISSQQRTCLLADSILLRGAVTAYAWMSGTEGGAFDPKEGYKACDWTTKTTRASAADVYHALMGCYRLLELEIP